MMSRVCSHSMHWRRFSSQNSQPRSRNVAVHAYRQRDPAVVRTVVGHRLDDCEPLCKELVSAS